VFSSFPQRLIIPLLFFFEGANWSPAGVPATGDDLTITTAGITVTMTAVHSGASAFGTLTLGSTVTLACGSFALQSSAIVLNSGAAVRSKGLRASWRERRRR
jgi:hypothetical protein